MDMSILPSARNLPTPPASSHILEGKDEFLAQPRNAVVCFLEVRALNLALSKRVIFKSNLVVHVC